MNEHMQRHADGTARVLRASGLGDGRLMRFDRLPSTNSWALVHLGELRDGDAIWAAHQTAGRGRFERVWVAPAGTALAFSIVLRGAAFVPLGANLGQVAAWAVLDTLLELAGSGSPIQLKWPNDVMLDGRKVAGILVEKGAPDDAFVVGIGLNINVSGEDFAAAGLDRTATSLRAASGRVFDLDDVLAKLLGRFAACLDRTRREGLAPLLAVWSAQDWLAGQDVEVALADGRRRGHYLGLDSLGRLRLRAAGGTEQALWTGDVERVTTAPSRTGRRPPPSAPRRPGGARTPRG